MERGARIVGTMMFGRLPSCFLGAMFVLLVSGCAGDLLGIRGRSLSDAHFTNAITAMLDAQTDLGSTGRRVDLCQLPIWLNTDRLVMDPTYLKTEVKLSATDRTVREVMERVVRETQSKCMVDPWGQVLYVGRDESEEHARRLETPLGRLTGAFTNEESVCGTVRIWDLVAACNDMLEAYPNGASISKIVFDNTPPQELVSKQRSLEVLKLENISLRSLLWTYAMWWRAHATYDEQDKSLHFYWGNGALAPSKPRSF